MTQSITKTVNISTMVLNWNLVPDNLVKTVQRSKQTIFDFTPFNGLLKTGRISIRNGYSNTPRAALASKTLCFLGQTLLHDASLQSMMHDFFTQSHDKNSHQTESVLSVSSMQNRVLVLTSLIPSRVIGDARGFENDIQRRHIHRRRQNGHVHGLENTFGSCWRTRLAQPRKQLTCRISEL